MTATPIPRTLLMTSFGDMDTTKLDEKPVGRIDIDTRVMPVTKIDSVANALKNIISKDKQVYWVCPLVEESEKLDLTAVEERFKYLVNIFGEEQVAMVHGKMKSDEKQTAMDRFSNNSAKILVATTVIEVGVDVPNATTMVIEQAERFGLSQLHQLRGRVGRNSDKSNCILMYGVLSETSSKRLQIMKNSQDGFLIAEEDLKLRGPGDILGTRQSGLPEMLFADLINDKDLLEISRNDANHLLSIDPKLETERGQNIRTLLYLFERDKALNNLNQ